MPLQILNHISNLYGGSTHEKVIFSIVAALVALSFSRMVFAAEGATPTADATAAIRYNT
jgi:hypothetical protein